jgi:WD40 repeat protein
VTAPSLKRINDWCNGRSVPASWPQFELVVRVLIEEARAKNPRPAADGLYRLSTWKRLWMAARESPYAEHAVCPYRGLEAFQEKHAGSFYGREKSTETLLTRLNSALTGAGGLLMLVGSSGVGKSSLLRAGLVPAIQKRGLLAAGSQGWPIIIATPGHDPVRELTQRIPGLDAAFDSIPRPARDGAIAASADGDVIPPFEPDPDEEISARVRALTRAAIRVYAEEDAGEGARLIIVIDQFEELFTLSNDERQRGVYVEMLRAACTPESNDGHAPALVVASVRADFYDLCLEHPGLAEALQDRQMVLRPMTAEELQEAVIRPAKTSGLRVEPGLVELLLRDAGVPPSRGGHTDAGMLPLVSHALGATWEKRNKDTLTVEGYRATGGIHGAVETTAERAWGGLNSDSRRAALELLLQLTRIGRDGTHDTRGRCDKKQLLAQTTDRAAAEAALETLVKARLVTLDAEWAQLAHEALLQAWPRLRERIDHHREGLLLRQRLEDDAAMWQNERRDSSLLYRGSRLENAQQRAVTADLNLPSDLVRSFLADSIKHHRRRRHLIRAAFAVITILSAAAVIAAGIANKQRNDALFANVVAEADRQESTNPSLSALLDLVAHRFRPDNADVAGRVLSSQNTSLAQPLHGDTGTVYYTAFSPDGQTLATASYEHTVQLWDLSDRAHPAPLGAPLIAGSKWISSAAFSPDGNILAAAGGDGTVRLWDTSERGRPKPLGLPLDGHNGSISLLAFSPDGHTLATANNDHTVRLWNITNPIAPVTLGVPLTGHTEFVRSVAFSPDGRTLAAGSDDYTVLLWNVVDSARPFRVATPLTGHTGPVHSVAFSPDSRTLATGSDDKTARLWNVTDPNQPVAAVPLSGHEGAVWSVTFSPDGRTLATGSKDGSAKLWNVTDLYTPRSAGATPSTNTGGILAVAFSPDGYTLATGGEDGTTLLWTLPTTVLIDHISRIYAIAFSPNGRLLATGSSDRTARLWDVSMPTHPVRLGPPQLGHTGYAKNSLAFSPDGQTLATQGGDQEARLWDVSNPRHLTALGGPIPQNIRYADAIAFSPDGQVLATGDTDPTVRLWNVSDLAHPVALADPLAGHQGFVNSIAFSPNGLILATASSDGTARLWNVDNPAHPAALGMPLDPDAGQILQVAFSPDGHTLAATGEDKTVRMWNVTDPAYPIALRPLLGHLELVTTVAFSPDGHTLASGSADRTVRLWNVTTPENPTGTTVTLTGHTGTVNSISFSPDGRTLATGSEDNTVMLWNLDIDHAIERTCSAAQGILTPEQWRRTLPQLPYKPPC